MRNTIIEVVFSLLFVAGIALILQACGGNLPLERLDGLGAPLADNHAPAGLRDDLDVIGVPKGGTAAQADRLVLQP